MKFKTILTLVSMPSMFNICQADKLNPITRVVQLLEGLAKKVEQDGKKEEDLFETYVCWAKKVIKTKTESNEAAKARIEELTQYIDDIESGRIEFTSENGDLTAAVKSLKEEIETADDIRDKEGKDFLAAKDEMEKAIAALEQAVDVLDEATKEHSGSLLSIKRVVQTFQEGEHTGVTQALKNAVELGKRYLSKGDALFLQRLLSGEVPKADWKKLNRKSTFKSKYKARSGKIQQILADMLTTFKDNLADAEKKEAETKKSHSALMDAKSSELKTNQDALATGEKEGNARKAAAADAKQEVADLQAQVKADTGYITQTEEAYKDMKEQWAERSKLRELEVASINQAIAILNSDDARETMKGYTFGSFISKGYLLLQKSAKSKVRERASAMLRQAGTSTTDSRLTSMALMVLRAGGPLDDVVASIEEMISTLKAEEESDLVTKEKCEEDRELDTGNARDLSVQIDDMTDLISKNKGRIAELKPLIEEKEADNLQFNETEKEATRNRADEHAAFQSSLADDQKAAELIASAKDVLANFYKDNDLAFVQNTVQKAAQPGKAPPPPPPTFDAPYGGAKGESTGIQAILEMILNDVKSDIEEATKAEKQAVEEFEKVKSDIAAGIKANNKAIEDMAGEIAECEDTIESTISERSPVKGTLDSVMQAIEAAKPGCEFMTINFPVRAANRQMEIDGLLKAKAILQT